MFGILCFVDILNRLSYCVLLVLTPVRHQTALVGLIVIRHLLGFRHINFCHQHAYHGYQCKDK